MTTATDHAPAISTPRRILQRVELGAIPLVALAALALPVGWRWEPELRWLFGYAAATILGQGLLRDLARLALRRGGRAESEKLVCLCAESSLGLTLLLVGAGGLTLLGVTQTVTITPPLLSAGLLVLLGVGFLTKDYVLVLRRVEDHSSIRPW